MPTNDYNAWESRWNEGRIGFHRDSVNPHLVTYLNHLKRTGAKEIAVPLCGKSLDLIWLKEQDWNVTGIELVQKAIHEFFSYWNKRPTRSDIENRPNYRHENLNMLNADIFDLPVSLNGQFDAIYDRAAIVALPPAMRIRYADILLKLLKPGGRALIITYEAPTAPDSGPPYNVYEEEIPNLFSSCRTKLLESFHYLPESEPKLKIRGLAWCKEQIWLVESTKTTLARRPI